MPSISVEGTTIHYLDEGHGPPILLLHAFPLSAEMFAPQRAALSARYRLITPDHRGFGASGLGAGPAEMSLLARDAIALLNALSIPRAVIGGVSMGGYATMALLRESPERARAIVLADTQMAPDDEPGKVKREELARAVEARGMAPLVEAFLPRLLAPGAPAELKLRVTKMIEANRPEGSAAALRGLAMRSSSRDVLAAFGGPALIIVGAEDTITGPDKAKLMADQLAHARVVTIPGAGHLANLEAPEAFNAALDGFMTELDR